MPTSCPRLWPPPGLAPFVHDPLMVLWLSGRAGSGTTGVRWTWVAGKLHLRLLVTVQGLQPPGSVEEGAADGQGLLADPAGLGGRRGELVLQQLRRVGVALTGPTEYMINLGSFNDKWIFLI